ncbi:MAG: cytochrome c3 family protein [bacterium]|nr:cytochrome c3 family protein [bacterium]
MRRILPIILALLFMAVTAAAVEAKVFDHDFHVGETESDCGVCHQEADLDIAPPLERCEECHEKSFLADVKIPARVTQDSFWYRDHGPYAEELVNNCASCYREDFCLDCHKAGFADEQGKLNVHRSDFRVTHPIHARADNRSCTVCHEERFCSDCHSEFAPEDLAFESHRRSWSDLPTGGGPHDLVTEEECDICHSDSVLPSHDWTDTHAREARRSLPTCQACHPDADVCLKCHSAREGLIVNPHPRDWDDMKDYLDGASGGKTCRRCH